MDTTDIPPCSKRAKTQDSQDQDQENEFEPVPGCSAISIHLVDWDLDGSGDASQISRPASNIFEPEFTHQIFGDEEVIKGYRGLEVVILLDAKTFYSQVSVRYEEVSEDADDVAGKLADALEPGLVKSAEEFEEKVNGCKNNWLTLEDLGRVVEKQSWKQGELAITFDVLSEASPKLKELHARLEPFMTFFIDGFDRIDPEDSRWEIYMAGYKTQSSLRVVGFAVVYNLPAFPKGVRKKVGQAFVMPNHQGSGVCKSLLSAIHKIAEDGDIVDVTLVDPSPRLRSLRDKWDIARLVACQWIREWASQAIELQKEKRGIKDISNGKDGVDVNPESIVGKAKNVFHSLALNIERQRKIQADLKISKTQVLLLWEALLMVETNGDTSLVAIVKDFVECRMMNTWGMGIVANKTILQVKNDDGSSRDDFIMLKCCNIPSVEEALKHGLILTPAEACLREEKKSQVDSEVEQRMEELAQMAAKYWQ